MRVILSTVGNSKKFRLRSQIFEEIRTYTPCGGVGFNLFCFGLLSIVCLFGACTRYDIEGAIGFQPSPGDAIQFDFNFEQPQLFLGEPDTRTAGFPIDTGYNPGPDNSALPFRYRTKFVNGDAIGIYVVKHYPGVPGALSSFISENFANNIKAVYDSVPGTRATWTLTDSIYHPGGDSELDFYAYYPYQPDIHYGYPTWDFYPPDPNDIPYKANMNQNTPAGFYGSDFLLGIARNIRKSVPKSLVTMQPKHAMALVEAKVFYPPGEPVDPTVNLALINVKSAASISLSDSSAKKVGNAPPPYFSSRIDSIVMYNRGIITGTSSVDTVVYWAVVPPQKIAVGTDSSTVSKKTGTLLFSRRDSVYIAADSMSTSAPATAVQLELEAGKVTTLKLKLKN